jgi:type IV pilus assembly protein PilB
MCTRYEVIPVAAEGNTLLVAMSDPTNLFALDDIRLSTGKDIRAVVASPEQIEIMLSRLVNLDEWVDAAVDAADDWEDERVELTDIKSDDEIDAPAIKLINQIITQAVTLAASDVHFEPTAEQMEVRFRKDGVLDLVATVPNKLRAGVTSRLKIMANMDISEKRIPQDGRVPLRVGEKPIDLRVAVLPTVYGEQVVIRILDKGNVSLGMGNVGFLPDQLQKLRNMYTQPYGCLLVTGPTGSGKSTTLYSALAEVSTVEKKVITVEDPVEYRIKGINQVQVHAKAGMTFAAALRSILRCDPDIVMIGEMRDHETAAIGIEAALTGHMVMSTLHTNTAPGAVTRLIEMGIEPFLVTSSLLGVMTQRLARRLCKCKEEFVPTREYLHDSGFPADVVEASQIPVMYRPGRCTRCSGKGYAGRMGLHEVMVMSEGIAQLALERASAEEIARQAEREGMCTLYNDGLRKVLRGDTTVDELNRIIQRK